MDALPFIQYRAIRAGANASASELANLDAHIAGILAANPPCLVTINVQPMGKPKFTVSVDINKQTVSDLADRIGLTMGHSPERLRLIHRGRHVDSVTCLCRDVGIQDGALINVCLKLGCPGYGCCDATYNMLGDALLRQASSVAASGALTNLTHDELDKVFTLMSKLEAAKPPRAKPWRDSEPAPAAATLSSWPKDLQAALLAVSASPQTAAARLDPLSNDMCTAAAAETKPPRTPSPASRANQDATNLVLPASDDEDLYG